jgi:hypothetical protein
MKMLLTMSDSELRITMTPSFLEELFIHLKMCSSQANFQQHRECFDLQDRPFPQCVIVVKLISDYL